MNNINSNDKNKTPQSAPAAGKDSTDQHKDTRSAISADNTQKTGGKDAAQGSQSSAK